MKNNKSKEELKTERHKRFTQWVQKLLKLRGNHFFDVLDQLNDGAYIVNKDFNIEYVNPIIKEEFGPTEGKKCYEYFHGNKESCDWCKNEAVYAGKSVMWEWHSEKNNKVYKYSIRLTVAPVGFVN